MVGHSHVPAQAVSLIDRHIEFVSSSVFDQEILALAAVEAHLDQSRKEADAMFDVHHLGAGLHIGEEGLGCDGTGSPCPAGNRSGPAKDLGVGEQMECRRG